MRYCDECGAECEDNRIDSVWAPTCPTHGPRWLLVRTGAAADVLVQRDGRVLSCVAPIRRLLTIGQRSVGSSMQANILPTRLAARRDEDWDSTSR